MDYSPPLNVSKRLTSMNKDVPLEVVTAPKGSKAVFTNKIFGNLYLKRTILFHYHHLGARVRYVMRLSLCPLLAPILLWVYFQLLDKVTSLMLSSPIFLRVKRPSKEGGRVCKLSASSNPTL